MPPLPRQHSAAIGCTKTASQKEWLYTRIALRALKVSYSDVGEGGVAVNCEKTLFFLNTLYIERDHFLKLCLYVVRKALIPPWSTFLLVLIKSVFRSKNAFITYAQDWFLSAKKFERVTCLFYTLPRGRWVNLRFHTFQTRKIKC